MVRISFIPRRRGSQDSRTAGIAFGIRGIDIVYSAEVRVAILSHCWDGVWNPGYGYRLFRGGEGRKTFALLGLRFESRADIVASTETGRKIIIPLGDRWVWGRGAHGTGARPRFLSVRLRGWLEVWLARWVLDSPRGWAFARDSLSEFPDEALGCAGVSGTGVRVSFR